MASSSSTTLARNQFRYDVFLSFSGEDTRKGFTSHLYAALCRKSINTFIDNELRRGEEIAPSLLRAIEESKIAVVIFSKNYAASRWCLDELAKIMEYHQNHGKLVIPIFYHVDPSDVRKQTGDIANAFTVHGKVPMEKVQMWKAALRAAANLSGWASQDIGSEFKLIDDVSKDIFKKLNQTSSHGIGRLVRMDSHIKTLTDLLSLGSFDVRMVGIWGMGGIGKTTIAEVIFERIKSEFDASSFLHNVRENSEQCDGLTFLTRKLLSEMIGESDIKISTPNNAIQNMLRGKKVLIVLDDVNKIRQLEVLADDPCWFGLGSRIIITSRDKQVLKRWINHLYQVNGLRYNDALQLFNWNAFKQNHPREDFMVESNLLVKYANGNPLVLKVLGFSLFEKSKEEWESAVKELERTPPIDVQDVLKISYKYLGPRDKQIFLHVACFFKGESEERVRCFLDSCGFSSKIGISNLMDKSLVSIVHGELQMHDLVQQMGRAIVDEESIHSNKRSRLWNHEDIYEIFTRNMESYEVIEGISLDMSKLSREIYLKPDAFAMMPNLKLLKFYVPPHLVGSQRDQYKVKLDRGLESLPNGLRYFEWHGYPCKTLPVNFELEHLIELHMPNSAIERVWGENKNSEKFKRKESSHSQSLIKALATTQARSPGNALFEGLYKVISGLSYLRSLARMSMENCKTIQSLPDDFVLPNLEFLDLSGCSNLKSFPLVSRNIKELRLIRTAIAEVPSSVECLDKLQRLTMWCCSELKKLPNNIYKLKSLAILSLFGCLNLKNFPDILKPMEHLVLLSLIGTAIENIPPSVEHLRRLQQLDLRGCKSLVHLPESLSKLGYLDTLDLAGCSKLERQFEGNHDQKMLEDLTIAEGRCNPLNKLVDLNCPSCLRYLNLSGLDFEQLPQGINQASQLLALDVNECKRLRSLLELPLSLQSLRAENCTSLERVSALKAIFESPENAYFEGEERLSKQTFIFTDCYKLDHNAWSVSGAETLQKMQRFATAAVQTKSKERGRIEICFPGGEIPDWIRYKTEGNSIRIQAQPDWNPRNFLGFAMCVVVEASETSPPMWWPEFRCEFLFGDSEDRTVLGTDLSFANIDPRHPSEHVLLWYVGTWYADLNLYPIKSFDMSTGKVLRESPFPLTNSLGMLTRKQWEEISFSLIAAHKNLWKVKKLGVLPLFAQDEEMSARAEEEEHEAIGNNKRCRGGDDYIVSGKPQEEKELAAIPRPKKLKQTTGIPAQPSNHMEDD